LVEGDSRAIQRTSTRERNNVFYTASFRSSDEDACLIESKEIKELVRSVIENVEAGLKEGYEISDNIDFELAVVNVKRAEGGLKLFVVDASAKYTKESINRIKFSIKRSRKFYIV
jgi:hypothetical protein